MTLSGLVPGKSRAAFWVGVIVSVCLTGQSPVKADLIYYSTAGELPGGSPNSQIKRANLNGSGVQTILSNPGSGRFGGIAFDVANGHLYTGNGNSIIRANLDGSGRTVIATSPAPVGDVEVDLVHRKIYWGGFNQLPNRLFRANLDGTNVESIFSTTLGGIEGLAIDPVAGKLYLALLDIHVLNLDGSGHAIFRDLPAGAVPFDVEIDLANGRLYWNDGRNGLIQRTTLTSGGGIETIFTSPEVIDNGIHFDVKNQALYFANRRALLPSGILGSALDLTRINANGAGPGIVLTDSGRFNYPEVLPTQAQAAIPEPSTITLFIIGIAGLLGYVRRASGSHSPNTGSAIGADG